MIMNANSESYTDFLSLYELCKNSSGYSYQNRELTLTCEDSLKALDSLGETFEKYTSGESNKIIVRLYTEKIRVFPNKDIYFKDFHDKGLTMDFALLEYEEDTFLFFSHNDNKAFKLNSDKGLIESDMKLIDNTIYFKKICDLVGQMLAIYNDKARNELILASLSGNKAFPIGYPQIQKEGLLDYDLNKIFHDLQEQVKRKDFTPFLNNEICRFLANEITESRYEAFLKQYELIIESATLDFEIYLKNFSFDKVKTKFRDSRDKYFNTLQEINSKFSSRLGSLVISVAASVFATFRFKSEQRAFSGILMLIAYILYAFYNSYEIALLKDDIINIKDNFEKELYEIHGQSSVIANALEEDSIQIRKKIAKTINRLPVLYIAITLLNSLVFVFIIVETFTDMYLPAILLVSIIICLQYCYFGKSLFENQKQDNN
jgi:hypothetical protein